MNLKGILDTPWEPEQSQFFNYLLDQSKALDDHLALLARLLQDMSALTN